MAQMNTKFQYMYDAASTVSLRAKSAAALTADTNGDALVLDALEGYWNTNGELADKTFAVVIHVTALDTSSADETYAINLQAGPVGFASNVVIGTLPSITKTGQYVILVDINTVKALKADAAAIRLVTDVGGTTPSIDFYAWISGVQK